MLIRLNDMVNSKSKYSIQKSILINSIGVVFLLFTQWLLTITITKINGFSDVGRYTLAVSFTNIFYIIASFNIRSYQVSDIEPKFSENVYLSSKVVTILFTVIIFVFFLYFSNFSVIQMVLTSIYFLYRMVDVFVDVTHGVFQKRWRFELITQSNILRGIFTYLSFTVAFLFIKKLEISMILLLFSSIIVLIYFDIKNLVKMTNIRINIKNREILTLLYTCLPIMLASVFTMLSSYIPRMEIGNILGEEALGIFAAISVPTLLIQVGAGILMMPLTTHFAEIYDRKEYSNFAKEITKFTLIFAGLSFLIYYLSQFVSSPVLKILYGQDIEQYISLFQPMIFVSILTSFQIYFITINIVFRDSKAVLLSGISGVIFSILVSQRILISKGLSGTPFIFELILISQIAISIVFIIIHLVRRIITSK